MLNNWLDKTMRRIINEVVEELSEYGVTFSQVVECYNIAFGCIYYVMRDPRMPAVNFYNGIGSFKSSHRKVLRRVNRLTKMENPTEDPVFYEKTMYRLSAEKENAKRGKKIKKDE